jgi:hypothetical protein
MPGMLALLPLLAATALNVQQAQDVRCVALLAIVANEQARGTGWSDVDALKDSGARYAGVVGETAMKTTGRTREEVRDMILGEVASIQKAGALPRADVDRCIARIAVVAPAPTPPTLPRCAAIIGLAYDAVKARDGLTKAAKDLATLASVLSYRARTEGAAKGQGARQVDDAIAAERATAAKAGEASDDDLQACAALAAVEQ